MLNLMQAEWLKLSRRPMARILLGVFLLLLFTYLTIWFLVVALHTGIFGGNIIQFFNTEQIEEFRKEVAFPGVWGSTLGQVNGVGGICAIILAAGALGSEYNWGTLRLQLARQPDRGRYLLAKTLVLFFVLLVGMIIALLFSSLLALLYGSILGNVGSVSLRDVLLLVVGVLRSLYVILPYVLVTLAICVIGRSVFTGVAGGMVFLFLDNGSASMVFLTELDNPLITFLVHLPLQQNINTLVLLNRSSYGLDPGLISGLRLEQLPHPLQATLIIALYSTVFAGYAYYSLTRQDIGGAT
jgi:ABC-type transport system involved in multi-copper enzyme maturation permease subunit